VKPPIVFGESYACPAVHLIDNMFIQEKRRVGAWLTAEGTGSGEGSIGGIDTGWSAQGAGRVPIMAIGRNRPHSVVLDP
jgi:hypothetical protein